MQATAAAQRVRWCIHRVASTPAVDVRIDEPGEHKRLRFVSRALVRNRPSLDATDTRSAEWLNDAARAIDGIVLALDPDGRLPLVVAGSIGQRLQRRLAPSIRARLVEPAGDAVDGALHLIRARLEKTGRRFDGR